MKYVLNEMICFLVSMVCWFLVCKFIDKDLAFAFALTIGLTMQSFSKNRVK